MRRFRWSSPMLALVSSMAISRLALADDPPPPPPPPPPPAVETAPLAPPPPAPEPMPPPPPAPPPFALTPAPAPVNLSIVPVAVPAKIDTASTTIKFGLLLQPQFEAAGDVGRNGYANNIYLRRMRLLVGGTLFGVIDYFVETDSPNTLKAAPGVPVAGTGASLKNPAGMSIQDAFATWKPMGDLLKVDVGYMLPPMAHNAIQGATTLYGWDYYAYTFRHSDVFGTAATPVGRDVGAELRGLVLGGHLEYRAGIFQGLRNPQTAAMPPALGNQGARNFMRVLARLQINFLDAEPGFFYAGTYFGAKRILSIGGSYDFQDDYAYYSFDGIADLPLGPGVLTAQVNYAHWDGGTFTVLPKQWAVMGEAGYNLAEVKVSPIVRIEHLDVTNGAKQTRYAGGIAFWPFGHNSNLKFFYTRTQQDAAAHGANQFNLQWQIYFF